MRPFLWLALAGALLAASCTIQVTGPIALDDEAEVEFEGQVTIDVLLNDRRPESLTIVDPRGGRGSVLIQDNGKLLYTAPAGFSGEDEFTYSVISDTFEDPAEAAVVVTVGPPLDESLEIIEPSLVDFGEVAVDGEAFQEVRVTNAGPGRIPVEAPFIEPGSSPGFEVVGSDCGRDLEGGESCGVVLAFRPADTGPHLAALALGDGHQISIRGVGVGSGKNPGLQPEPSFVDFGKVEVGSAAAREVRFTNPGPGSIGVEGTIFERGISTGFHINSTDCRTDIAEGASCVVAVAFQPINEGPHSAVLTLGGGARVELHGTGTGTGISADLVVTYSPSRETVAAGQTLIYESIVHNHGPDSASNVTVSVTLPTEVTLVEVTLVSVQGSCTILQCKLGTLNSGASATVLVEVKVNGGVLDGAVLTSTASVDSDVIDPSRANNTMSAGTRVQPAIAIDIDIAIAIAIDGIVRGDEGEIKEVAVEDVDPDHVGARCTAETTQTDEGGSEHPNNDFIIASGGTSAEIEDFEAVSGAPVAMSGAFTLGDSITVSLRLGPNRVSSGGFVITLTCTPPGATQ